MTAENNKLPEPGQPRISRWPRYFYNFVFVWSLAALWYLTIPDFDWPQWLIYPSGAMIALLLLSEASRVVAGARTRTEIRRLALSVASFAVVIAVCATNTGLIVRIYLSEDALLTCLREVEADAFDFDNRNRVGCIPIRNAYVDGETGYIATGNDESFGSQGIGYSKSGTVHNTWKHLYGPWYLVKRSYFPATRQDPTFVAIGHLLNQIDDRLGLMEEVAQFKYAANKPIADPEREQELLDRLEEKAKARSLPPHEVRRFFAAQIEAAKLLQQNHFERWRKAGSAPKSSADLIGLRLQIDLLNDKLLDALAEFRQRPAKREMIEEQAGRRIFGLGIDDRVRNLAVAPLLDGR